MKKFLLLATILSVAICSQTYATATEKTQTPVLPQKQMSKPCNGQFHKPPMAPDKANFDKRLKLTDKQKDQAKEIHKKGFDEIKPIMEQIRTKHEEIEAVKRSDLKPEAQAEKIVQLRKEIQKLKHQSREIQMKNMKEFESILTAKQKKELEKIKKEGRKKFEKEHKKPMFKMPPRNGDDCIKEPPFERPVPAEK